ncbi:MAG TPA: hypothetical protein VMJ90_00355, partial [Anaerolineales bacterium]|nr:hypothetical protein [Anaerolineales bacterium]
MSILNTYYVNEAAKKDLYPVITPVNTFHVIFNNYFGTSYPLLEDFSYYTGNMNDFTPKTSSPTSLPREMAKSPPELLGRRFNLRNGVVV